MPAKKFKNIGIVAKVHISKKHKELKGLVNFLKKQDCKIHLDENTEPLITGKKGLRKKELLKICDLVIVLGGDGTLLKTAGNLGKKKVHILGVNVGTVGFLTELTFKNLLQGLKRILKGEYIVDQRTILSVLLNRKGKIIKRFFALNEAVINQGAFARLIELDVEVDSRKLATFKGDGLIIGTPTGSTAHSLSAGGPIIHPEIEAFIVNPICPASLSMRPIIVPDDRKIKITLKTPPQKQRTIGLTIDGQVTFDLEYKDEIAISRSDRSFDLVRLPERDYYENLHAKLKWGE